MSATLVVLAFVLCSSTLEDASCEQGTVETTSCERAERWVRGAMRPGQDLAVLGCEPAAPRVVGARR